MRERYLHIRSKTKKVTVSSTYTYMQVRSVLYLAARVVCRRARLPVSYLLLLWVWNGKWEEVWGKVWIILTSSLYVQYMYIYTAAVAPPSGSNSESHLVVASNCHVPPEFTQLILQHDFGLATVQYSVFRLRFKLFFKIFFMCVRWKGWL